MARAALRRRAIRGKVVEMRPTPVCCLAASRATYGPYRPPLDGPFRRAKNGPTQMRRPVCLGVCPYMSVCVSLYARDQRFCATRYRYQR